MSDAVQSLDAADRAELEQWRTLRKAVASMASATEPAVPLWPNTSLTGHVQTMAKLLHALLEQPATIAESVVEALEFYADPHSYFAIAFMADHPCGAFAEDLSEDEDLGREVFGKRARETLAMLEARLEAADTPEVRELFDLIGAYWNLAYAEGIQGRQHDTDQGDAAKTWHQIQTRIRRLAISQLAGPPRVDEDDA